MKNPESKAGREIYWIYLGGEPTTIGGILEIATPNHNGLMDLGAGAAIHTVTMEELIPENIEGPFTAAEVHTPPDVRGLFTGDYGLDLATGVLLIYYDFLQCWRVVDRRTNPDVIFDAQLILMRPSPSYMGDQQKKMHVSFRRGDPTSFGGVYLTPSWAGVYSP